MTEVSIIIPVLNEARHIESLLASLYNGNSSSIEVFVLDGGSTDGTPELIKKLGYPNLYLRNNPRKFVSFGFNDTFPFTRGKYIALLGAHACYPKHYFDNAIHYLTTECDVVGGPLTQKGKTTTGSAISIAMSSKFGVGGTEFRTEKKKMLVDSVAFAVYKREIFETVGLLDEDLLRNQDDELHYRMNAHHYKILMVPEMECTYYVRDSFPSLFLQYFQYGFYKPLVFAKVKSAIRIRHIIPSLFVIYFILLPLGLSVIGITALLPLLLYFIIGIAIAFKSSSSVTIIPLTFTAFIILHISYGSGFLSGIPKYIQQLSTRK